MISFYRRADIAAGKVGGAVAFAKEISAYIKDRFGVDVAIAMPIGGNPNRIGWAARYDDLTAFDAMHVKMISDMKYLEIVAKGSENFIPGSVHDELWRTL